MRHGTSTPSHCRPPSPPGSGSLAHFLLRWGPPTGPATGVPVPAVSGLRCKPEPQGRFVQSYNEDRPFTVGSMYGLPMRARDRSPCTVYTQKARCILPPRTPLCIQQQSMMAHSWIERTAGYIDRNLHHSCLAGPIRRLQSVSLHGLDSLTCWSAVKKVDNVARCRPKARPCFLCRWQLAESGYLDRGAIVTHGQRVDDDHHMCLRPCSVRVMLRPRAAELGCIRGVQRLGTSVKGGAIRR